MELVWASSRTDIPEHGFAQQGQSNRAASGRRGEMKALLVQALVLLAILLIPVSFVLRVVYGKHWLEWE